jgi:DNA-binding transcriptional LysR family regulator
MDALTFDQIQLLLAVVDEGSFSGAARKLRRAQSAVTYGIQRLEEQVGLALFDRSGYRPALTETGRALLPRARRIAEEAMAFRDQAKGLSGGLETEITLVLDAMFPMPPVVAALRAFSEHFPTVPPRIYVQSLGAAAEFVLNGTCMIGLLPFVFSDLAELKRFPLLSVHLLPVVSKDHPLAKSKGLISSDVIRQHVQLVLTDRSALTEGRDHGVLSPQTWRLADLGTKHAMLLAGLGWGSMPKHLVADDIQSGRLKVIRPLEFQDQNAELAMGAVYLAERPLGPATQWMLKQLVEVSRPSSP